MKLYFEGNNGGDYLRIKQVDLDFIALEVGHECVVQFHAIFPIEMITSALSEWYNNGMKLSFDEKYNELLKRQVEIL